MAVSILALKLGLAEVTIPIRDEQLRVTYRPGVITVGFNLMSDNWSPWWLAQAVEKWDLEGDRAADGSAQVVPLRATTKDEQGNVQETKEPSDELVSLPVDSLVYIRRKIVEDLLPGKRLRATSTAG